MTKKIYTLVVVAFAFTLSVCLLIVTPAINNQIASDNIRLEHLITDKSMKIIESIWIPINQLYTVAAHIERNNGNLENIEDLAASVVNNKNIRNLIIAPDGVVSHIYPDTEENRKVVGLDYFQNTSEGNHEAAIAAEKKELLLAGPFTTVVGDKAISGRYPIYLNDDSGNKVFWGLICITLRHPDVLTSTNLDSIAEQGYIYELWHVNVDNNEREVIMSNGVIADNSNYVDKAVKVLNAEWYLRIAPIAEWYQYPETYIYIFVSIIFSIMVAVLILKNIQLNHVKQKLEVMIYYDPLTSLLNRQGLFNKLDIMIKNHNEFIIYYLDLNYFKQINDKYGHAIGDKVLIEFAKRVNKHVGDNQLFARMGGDEFIIIHVENATSNEDMDAFWEKVNQEFIEPVVTLGDQKIYLAYSKGCAVYSVEKDILDDVISKADKQMYMEKRKMHL